MPKLLRETRHIIPISGKDSLCTAIVQGAREDLPYEYVFCDVKMELPETYDWLSTVESSLSITINRIGKSLRDVIAEQNMLPSHHRRFCTKYAKIFPIDAFIGKFSAVQYLGIRADEDRPGAGFPRPNVVYSYPLKDMGIGITQVYAILDNARLLPPAFFWQRLFDSVRNCISDAACKFVDGLSPWHRAGLFSWRSRGNCFNCFYQRMYEWVGLLEHHPDLFAEAEQLEYDFGNIESGNRRSAQNFYWRPDGPLSRIRERADEIFGKRRDHVAKTVNKLRWVLPDDGDDGFDMLNLVSCGVYCGK